MIKPITIDRWNQAQIAKRKTHTKSLEDGLHHYRIAYSHNFRYLGIDPDEVQVGIIEIGCADFPALRYVKHEWCVIVEPLPSKDLTEFVDSFGYNELNASQISLFTKPFEEYDGYLPDREIWMFNVLQHVQDPEAFIAKAKQAKTIRYFEPIETEIIDYHPHSFSFSDFERWFGKANKYYNQSDNECFHNGPCCYGVWKNESC